MPTNDQITITVAAFAFALWLVAFVCRNWRRASRQAEPIRPSEWTPYEVESAEWEPVRLRPINQEKN